MLECWTVRHPIDQSSTGIKILTMPGQVRYWTKPRQSGIFFGPVPDWNYWCRNADAGVSFLDTNAQLCLLDTYRTASFCVTAGRASATGGYPPPLSLRCAGNFDLLLLQSGRRMKGLPNEGGGLLYEKCFGFICFFEKLVCLKYQPISNGYLYLYKLSNGICW
jgi:hypothetical protein